MKGCSLVDEFLRNKRKYIVYKHQFSKKSNNERVQRIIKFLQFCCSKGTKHIKDISKAIYDDFMRSISDKSLETQRKYRLAVSEFAERARLNFKIVKNVDRQKERKFLKLKAILKDCNDIEQCRDEIMNLF